MNRSPTLEMLTWQECRRTVTGVGGVLMGLVVMGVTVLMARQGGPSAPSPSALVPPAGDTLRASVTFANAAGILMPEALVIWFGLILDDVHRHGRAIWTAYPPSAVTRALGWFTLMTEGFALGAFVLALLFQAAAPTLPWADVVYVLPVTVWITGIMFGSRSPQLGAVVSILVSFVAYGAQEVVPRTQPAWWMLYAAASFRPGPLLTLNRLAILGCGLLAWALGAVVYGANRHRGMDI